MPPLVLVNAVGLTSRLLTQAPRLQSLAQKSWLCRLQEAVPAGLGAMAAILGMDLEKVTAVCGDASQGEVCEPANINSPDQIVISGHASAVERATNLVEAHWHPVAIGDNQRVIGCRVGQLAADAGQRSARWRARPSRNWSRPLRRAKPQGHRRLSSLAVRRERPPGPKFGRAFRWTSWRRRRSADRRGFLPSN